MTREKVMEHITTIRNVLLIKQAVEQAKALTIAISDMDKLEKIREIMNNCEGDDTYTGLFNSIYTVLEDIK